MRLLVQETTSHHFKWSKTHQVFNSSLLVVRISNWPFEQPPLPCDLHSSLPRLLEVTRKPRSHLTNAQLLYLQSLACIPKLRYSCLTKQSLSERLHVNMTRRCIWSYLTPQKGEDPGLGSTYHMEQLIEFGHIAFNSLASVGFPA